MLSSSLTLDSVVRQGDDILAAAIGNELVLASVSVGVFCGMDEIAADLWRRLAAPCRVAELVAGLSDAYAGPPAEIAEDVMATVKRLYNEGFVVIVE